MQTVLYEGGFEDWLCAVFDVYEYRMQEPSIVCRQRFKGSIFGTVHEVQYNAQHSKRVWQGLEKKLSATGLHQVYQAFLSEHAGIEDTLLQFVQHVFSNSISVETDYGHPAVLEVQQTAKKVAREKHRMEAFVRFQKTADGLFYALIEPDHNVLPLIENHFTTRYADQRWLIFDGLRRYGIYYDLKTIAHVTVAFADEAGKGTDITAVYDADEAMYRQLWQQYFTSVNIAARKNKKLQLQHMPRRYWKHMPEILP